MVDKNSNKLYNKGIKRKGEVIPLPLAKTLINNDYSHLNEFRINEEHKNVLKNSIGRLGGTIHHGPNGETLNDFILEKRAEETKK
jgi:hypothetical protein